MCVCCRDCLFLLGKWFLGLVISLLSIINVFLHLLTGKKQHKMSHNKRNKNKDGLEGIQRTVSVDALKKHVSKLLVGMSHV